MPPQIALFLCLALVLYLLWIEGCAARGVSPWLWIPTFWVLMIGSRPLANWFVLTGTNESGSALDRWVLAGLTVTAIAVIAHRNFDWPGTLRRHKWLLALLLYMFASTLWSDMTLIALRRWAREVIVIPMAMLVMSETNPRRALASLLRRSAYILIPASILLIKYYSELGRQYGRWTGVEMWIGVTTQKNQLGRLCMISVFFLAWSLYRRFRVRKTPSERYQTWADVLVILLSLYLLRGADSSTSFATLLVGAATYLSLHLFRRMKIAIPRACLLALLIFVIGFGTAAPFMGGSNVAIFSASLNRNDTLTGRTEVWAELLPAVSEKAMLGSGFGSFWTDARRGLYDIPTAHNGYLDILLEVGEVGLAFYVVWLLSWGRLLHNTLVQDFEWASLGICLLLMCLIYNSTESALNSLTEHTTAVVVLTGMVLSCKPSSANNRIGPRAPAVYDIGSLGTAGDSVARTPHLV